MTQSVHLFCTASRHRALLLRFGFTYWQLFCKKKKIKKFQSVWGWLDVSYLNARANKVIFIETQLKQHYSVYPLRDFFFDLGQSWWHDLSANIKAWTGNKICGIGSQPDSGRGRVDCSSACRQSWHNNWTSSGYLVSCWTCFLCSFISHQRLPLWVVSSVMRLLAWAAPTTVIVVKEGSCVRKFFCLITVIPVLMQLDFTPMCLKWMLISNL